MNSPTQFTDWVTVAEWLNAQNRLGLLRFVAEWKGSFNKLQVFHGGRESRVEAPCRLRIPSS